MVQLQQELTAIKETGTEIVGISPDKTQSLKSFSDANGIEFTLLSDPGSKTIEAYELLYNESLPHPGTILVDSSGVVRAKLFREGYATRHTNEELIEAAKAIP